MKDKAICIRASQTEHSQIQAKAKAAGVTMSELILASALRRQLPISQIDANTYWELSQIKTEINRIGVNLNQIAKACNISRQLGEPVVVNTQLLERIEQHLAEIDNKVNQAMFTVIQPRQTNRNPY